MRSPSRIARRGREAWRPFASVGHWPRAGRASQVHFRLSREKRAGSAVLLRIDGRTFQLRGGGRDAWAPDRRADAEIVAAMRTGIEMVVETRSTRGALVRDRYRLRGAATAIDAAAHRLRPAPAMAAASSSPATARPCSTPPRGCRARRRTRR